LSHDLKKFKFLKKIIGSIGYKLIDKKSSKTERFIDSLSIKVEDIIKPLINKKKIKKIIQVGANDGSSDDFLFKCFNKELNAILIEPIKDAFIKLKTNYKKYPKVNCLNLALGVENGIKEIFSVNSDCYEFYKKKYNKTDVKWLTILSSFNKKHLINHGIKENHIISHSVNCITFDKLINDYDYYDMDLLIIDTEGYDVDLINSFIEKFEINPLIIFEWIHAEKNEISSLIEKLKKRNYQFLKVGRDLVCFQEKYFFV
jgi:FkbM family methyltransferase